MKVITLLPNCAKAFGDESGYRLRSVTSNFRTVAILFAARARSLNCTSILHVGDLQRHLTLNEPGEVDRTQP
jgi:hypothetical protein